jgi:hypothetical protein
MTQPLFRKKHVDCQAVFSLEFPQFDRVSAGKAMNIGLLWISSGEPRSLFAPT